MKDWFSWSTAQDNQTEGAKSDFGAGRGYGSFDDDDYCKVVVAVGGLGLITRFHLVYDIVEEVFDFVPDEIYWDNEIDDDAVVDSFYSRFTRDYIYKSDDDEIFIKYVVSRSSDKVEFIGSLNLYARQNLRAVCKKYGVNYSVVEF